MDTIIVAFFVMLGLVTAMAVGVIFGRKPIAGSCGGMKALAWRWTVRSVVVTRLTARSRHSIPHQPPINPLRMIWLNASASSRR